MTELTSWLNFGKYGLILIVVSTIIYFIRDYIRTRRALALDELKKAEDAIEKKYDNISDADLLDIANKRSGSDPR